MSSFGSVLQDVDKWERVQQRTTKKIRELGNMIYEGRMKELKLFKLEKRRLSGNVITIFKIPEGYL